MWLPTAQPLSKPLSAEPMGSSAKGRPIGLPLPGKASSANVTAESKTVAGQGRKAELSVTEMMQWLDSKLAGLPVQSASKASEGYVNVVCPLAIYVSCHTG